MKKLNAELVVIMKGGRRQRNVKGAVLADKTYPPFAINRDGYLLRWWGVDHPASKRIRELVKINGLCPIRAWCLPNRIRISKRGMAHHRCAFEEHGQLYQCPAHNNNGHERPLDRGDVTVRCAGVAFCGERDCPHAKPHRWDATKGCHAVHCRELEAIVEGWDKETKGEPPDTMMVCETLET